jgi:hypothetical protein
MQYVHPIVETEGSPKSLALAVADVNPDLATRHTPLIRPAQSVYDQGATDATAARATGNQQIADLSTLDLDQNRHCAVYTDQAIASKPTLALRNKDRGIPVAEIHGE